MLLTLAQTANRLQVSTRTVEREIADGQLLHTTCRTWQQWEAGCRRMHPAFWELWRIKTTA